MKFRLRVLWPSTLLLSLLLTGCEGRSLATDNPVFSDLPPRRSLVNSASLPGEQTDDQPGRSVMQVTHTSSVPHLDGNTEVAVINGRPLFVDDLVGSIRLTLDADSRYTDEQKQKILTEQIRQRLDQRVTEEIVVQALEAKIPEEQRDAVKEHIGVAFENFIQQRREEMGLKSDAEFDQALAQQGMSIPLLRETFFRVQMVTGYVTSLVEEKQQSPPNRLDLIQYYEEHQDEFTPTERVRWQEIRISKQKHGDQAARDRMADVVEQLNAGTLEFDQLARKYSDASSADKNGNKGWLERGSLTNTKLEAALFELPGGGLTQIFDEGRYVSLYRVARHEHATPQPFAEVQADIETAIKRQRQEAAKAEVLQELRDSAVVRTIFDEDSTL